MVLAKFFWEMFLDFSSSFKISPGWMAVYEKPRLLINCIVILRCKNTNLFQQFTIIVNFYFFRQLYTLWHCLQVGPVARASLSRRTNDLIIARPQHAARGVPPPALPHTTLLSVVCVGLLGQCPFGTNPNFATCTMIHASKRHNPNNPAQARQRAVWGVRKSLILTAARYKYSMEL